MHPLAVVLLLTRGAGDVTVRSESPTYEVTLPAEYKPSLDQQTPPLFVRLCGRENWAYVRVSFVDKQAALPQNPAGVKAEDVLNCIPLPPDSKWTFSSRPWKDFDIGTVEYHAAVDGLAVMGLAAVLPLVNGSVTVVVSAPEPLEKECRLDFDKILTRFTKAPTNWHPPEYYHKIQMFTRVGIAGVVVLALYPIAWAAFFRGMPLLAHWPRTLWLLIAAVLLFIPMQSPGGTTLISNVLVNVMLPLVLVMFAVRRIKMGIEEG